MTNNKAFEIASKILEETMKVLPEQFQDSGPVVIPPLLCAEASTLADHLFGYVRMAQAYDKDTFLKKARAKAYFGQFRPVFEKRMSHAGLYNHRHQLSYTQENLPIWKSLHLGFLKHLIEPYGAGSIDLKIFVDTHWAITGMIQGVISPGFIVKSKLRKAISEWVEESRTEWDQYAPGLSVNWGGIQDRVLAIVDLEDPLQEINKILNYDWVEDLESLDTVSLMAAVQARRSRDGDEVRSEGVLKDLLGFISDKIRDQLEIR